MPIRIDHEAPASELSPPPEGEGPAAGMEPRRRRFTVDEYYRMAAAGILKPEERVELIDGDIIEMSPIGSPHAAAVKRATHLFYRTIGDRAVVSVQDPVRLHSRSEPEPDLALLRPRADFYAEAHPTPKDVLLVVEVADTSEAYDRRVKFPRYAQAGIPEAWLLILSGSLDSRAVALEVHREPSPQGYGRVQRFGRGECLAPVAFPDVVLAVTDLLGA
jgi:Uma2 family endonuclease